MPFALLLRSLSLGRCCSHRCRCGARARSRWHGMCWSEWAAEQGVEVDGAAIPAFRDITSKQAAPQLNLVVRRTRSLPARGDCIGDTMAAPFPGALFFPSLPLRGPAGTVGAWPVFQPVCAEQGVVSAGA